MQTKKIVQRIVGNQHVMAIMAIPIILAIMKLLDVGCSGIFCSARGYAYALPLVLACLAFGIIGAFLSISLNLFSQKELGKALPTLALWIALGQVVTMVYIYLRSAFNHFIFEIEITPFEVWTCVLVLLYFLSQKIKVTSWFHLLDTCKKNVPLMVQLIVIAVLCVVVADREIPRLTMLSSDPDQHAFFARQIQRFGGIPYGQNAWGAEAFNYPAGSGTLVYAWSLFGFMDVRNVLAALPVLLTFFSAIVIAEQISIKSQLVGLQLAVLAFVLAMTAAGFMLPLYQQYSHMEGAGRQMSVAFSALFLVLCVESISANEMQERKSAFAISIVLFALAVLNPVNFILPVIFVAAAALYIYLTHRKKPVLIIFTPIAGMLLLLLDPYYTALIGLSKRSPLKFDLSGGLLVKSPAMWLSDTFSIYRTQSEILLSHFGGLLQSQAFPVFAVLLLVFSACAILLLRRIVLKTKVIIVCALVLLLLLSVDGAMMSFANDRRFYLLQPYLNASMAHYKILLLTFLCAWGMVRAFEQKIALVAMLGICLCMVTITAVSIRAVQPIRHESRQSYCGSMGCYQQTDLKVLEQFEEMTVSGLIPKIGEVSPRVLIPNEVCQMGIEKWLFPVSSARALPFYDVIPAAFYYYQGDADYTTDAYVQHVCNSFDRGWLKARNIHYIFLPANREAACIAELNSLLQSEEMIMNIGETYLLKIR